MREHGPKKYSLDAYKFVNGLLDPYFQSWCSRFTSYGSHPYGAQIAENLAQFNELGKPRAACCGYAQWTSFGSDVLSRRYRQYQQILLLPRPLSFDVYLILRCWLPHDLDASFQCDSTSSSERELPLLLFRWKT